jgi:amino acid adenylation domain-containing protein
MSPRRVEDIYPLSHTQQGMLYHALAAPGSGVYFEQMTCELLGALDLPAFTRAWQRVIERHPVLRTAFDWRSMDQPVQVVLSGVELPLSHQDWRGLEPAEQARRLAAELAAERARGFDLAAAPLVRLSLLRCADAAHHLIWNHHHLILDGWSMPLLFGELLAGYRAEAAGRAPELPPRPRPYRDYIAWLGRQDRAAAEAFWRRELSGFAAATPLGGDRRPTGEAVAGAPHVERELRLEAGLTAELQAFTQRQALTLNTLVQGCWALLLARHSGEEDVVFGVVVSGRPAELPGVEAMVGLFLGTLPLRLRVPPGETVLPWLASLQARLGEVLRFGSSPLVEVQGWSDVPRGLPLFESIVTFENYPVAGAGLAEDGGLRVANVRSWERTNYPLNLVVRPGGELALALGCDSGRFDEATAGEILRQLRGLLEQMARRPQARLCSLSLVTAESRRWLPDPCLPIAAPYHQPLPARFLAAAACWPEAPAVEQDGRTWIFRELAASATALARELTAAGLGGGEVVAVRGERAFGLVAAALAPLLAGGALLLVDRALPAARQRRMLEQAGVRWLLQVGEPAAADGWLGEAGSPRLLRVMPATGLAAAAGLAGATGLATASGVTAATSLAAAASLAPATPAGAEGLAEPAADGRAYLFFTSGTSGEPKAVAGRHRGLAHFLDWQRDTFAVGPGDRVAQLTGLSFDVVLRELFLPLTSGATLCLPGEGFEVASHHVPAWLERQRITLLHTVPALAQAWLAAGPGAAALGALRVVFFAGEPLTGDLVRRWRETFACGGEMINLYGPTETTLAKCWYRVPAEPGAGVQPIGAPLPQTQALILAGEGAAARLCGPLERGEIVLRTPFRSLGYLAPEEPASARFVLNPFDPAAVGDLVYRTGDQGRYRADGLLEILGRRDDQVKVRGVRVEPAEIEHALLRHPAVRQAAVAVRRKQQGEAQLVAYLVPVPGQEAALAPGELAHLARQWLPEPLVPSHFVLLDQLPLTANGKLDRAALAGARQELREPFVAPRDRVELALAQIWEELLGTASVGVADSFFTLGGHSLLVAPLLARIEKRFGQRLPLGSFFAAPTVERLAAVIKEGGARPPQTPLVPIQPHGGGMPFFCVHPLGGSALCYQALARHLPGQPFYGLDATVGADGGRSYASLEEMAAAYVDAVREAQPHGPYRLGGWSFGGLVAFEMARQIVERGEQVEMLALFDSHAPPPAAPDGPTPGTLAAAPAEVDQATILSELLGSDLDLSAEELRRLDPEEQLRHVVALGRRTGSLPPGYDVEMARLRLRIVAMHGRAVEGYRARRYPGRVTFFAARLGDRPGDQADAQANLERWRLLSEQDIEVRVVAGTHRELVAAPYVEGLAAELARCLAEGVAEGVAPGVAEGVAQEVAADPALLAVSPEK